MFRFVFSKIQNKINSQSDSDKVISTHMKSGICFVKPAITAASFVMAALFSGITSYAAIPIEDAGFKASAEQIQAVTYQYNMIPASIRQYFEDVGNTIYFFDTTPSVDDLLGAYSGQEGRNAKIILTNKDYGGAEAITHEMGHFFDDVCYTDEDTTVKTVDYRGIRFYITTDGNRYVSDTNDFKQIYSMERRNSPVTLYEKSDANEYFAGSFSLYCTDPESLMAYAPYTYYYIDNLVQSFTQNYPASVENIALTVTVPSTIDELTGGATYSGIFKTDSSGYSTASYGNESIPVILGSNTTQVSGVTENGVAYTGYTNVDLTTEEGAESAGKQIQNATAAVSNGDGTTTVTNEDGSVTTTTVKTTSQGIFVSVVTTYYK